MPTDRGRPTGGPKRAERVRRPEPGRHASARPAGGKPTGKATAPPPAPKGPPGLAARQVAVNAAAGVLVDGHTLDESLATEFGFPAYRDIAPRDRAFARLLATTIVRRRGELSAVVGSFLAKPLGERNARITVLLMAGAAQLLLLDTPPHAAISLAVDHVRTLPGGRHLDKLVNAVLRNVAAEGAGRLAALDPVAANVPTWMLDRWRATYGDGTARAIAAASLTEAALDLSLASDDTAAWAARLGGFALPTGSVRLAAGGRIEDLDGYAEGRWWVQDAAAALPARLIPNVAGRRVADLCAAPGGKTAMLAARGAVVTAVEVSEQRAGRIRDNLARLGLSATIVVADAGSWTASEAFDAVLIDAPCTATGTIRRHPDILHLRRSSDLKRLAEEQARLLDHAAALLRPGGALVFCTCSLEPEEGESQIAALLARSAAFERWPIAAGESGVDAAWINGAGEVRTLPSHWSSPVPGAPPGLDGFFIARLRRLA